MCCTVIVLFLYLVICSFRKELELVISRGYIFRSRSCFLSSFPSSFLTQQPVFIWAYYIIFLLVFYLLCFLTYLLSRLCPIACLVLSPALSCHPPCPIACLMLPPSLSFHHSSRLLAYYFLVAFCLLPFMLVV